MEKLSAVKKVAIARGYLSGLSYDELASKYGVSKGTVANVVAELKDGKFPEAADLGEQVELLRELSLELKTSQLTPGQSAVGLLVLKRISECGLDSADIGRWPFILKQAGSQEDAQAFVQAIYSIQEVQHKTGLSLEELLNQAQELEMTAAELEPVSKQLGERQNQLVELAKERDGLSSAVTLLKEKYDLLNPRVKELETREQELKQGIKKLSPQAKKAEATLDKLNDETQKLQDTGFSLDGLVEFNLKVQSMAKHHRVAPQDIHNRLFHELANLDQAMEIESVIEGLKKEVEKKKQAVAAAGQEAESLKMVISGLQQQKKNLQATIKETTEHVVSEIKKIVPAASQTVNAAAAELKRGHDAILSDVRRTKAEALEVGKEVGRFEGVLQANQWLADAQALVLGQDGLDSNQVRVVAAAVLRGVTAWLKRNGAANPGVSTLTFHYAESLLREMEQWKV